MLGAGEKALLAVLLLVLMFGMGAGLTTDGFRAVARRPFAPLLGLLSQFGWMPLIAYVLARVLGLPDDMAISLLVVGCVPGGTTSNLFTMYAKADVALSVSMTAISTIAAVVLMPLVLGLYGQSFTSASFSIPHSGIVSTLAVMLVPLALGMVARARWPARAPAIERVGSLAGIAVLLLLVLTGLSSNLGQLGRTSGAMFLAAGGVGLCGFGLGYLGAALARLPVAQRRAIAFETGIQNSPLALGIIVASFPESMHERMLWLPLLYALLVLVSATLLTLWWRRAPIA
ncbi:MAG: bile acid:sodium symporter [Deltaproteobacteria bacterium]|nr:bile acid:sodium symporter [Nannocystaceae bacterium]